jgi:hypothetical protein
MNKFIKALSVMLVLSSTIYLPNASAISSSNSTEMLITLAETDPALVDRLNEIALSDPKLLQQILKLAGSDAAQLERLLDLAENDPETFAKLVTIKEVASGQTFELKIEEQQMSTFGAISDGGLM